MDLPTYFRTVGELGLDACDLHMRLAGDVDKNLDAILSGLSGNGLALSSYSLSDDLTQEDDAKQREQIDNIKLGLRNAARLGTDTARVFGGHATGNDAASLAADLAKVTDALKECAEVAEEVKVTLSLENHGGMPGRGEEVLQVLDAVGSPFLKACCDIGNFMGADQSPEDGTRLVAPVTGYVHIKDNSLTDGEPHGRASKAMEGATVGEGVVDVEACLRILKDAGYSGYLALEYEGQEEEHSGVKKSLAFLRQALAGVEG